jgi:hypothetical protein
MAKKIYLCRLVTHPSDVVMPLFCRLSSACTALLLVCVAGMVGTGCKNPTHKVDEVAVTLRDSWKQRADAYSKRETRLLTWPEALRLMEERNPPLLKADEEVFRAKRQIGQVYKNLIPYVQLRAGVDKRIADLDSLSANDLRLDVNAFAVLSGLLTLRTDVYAAELTYLRSSLVREITRREKVVELHRMFTASRQLQLSSQRLADSERILRDTPAPRRALESAPATVATLREQIRAQQAELDADLTKILDMPEYRLQLDDQNLPIVDYAKIPLHTFDADRVGVLRRKLLAVELVGAQARVEGAKLGYWPDLSVFLTSGPLWTSRDGQTMWWRSEDTRISAYAYMPIDLNGQIGNRVRDAKADLAFLEREIALREAILVSEFEDKGRALVEAENEISEQERKRSLLMQLISIEGAENLAERLRQWAEIETRRENAVDRRAQLNAFFLFFDETFWLESSPLAASPAKIGEAPSQ